MADGSIVEEVLLSGVDVATRNLNSLGDAGSRVFGRLGTSAQDASKKTDQLSSSLDKTGTEARSTDSKITELSAKLASLGARARQIGTDMRQVGRNMSLYVTAPIVGLGVASVRSFTTFQQQMSNVSTLIDTNKESMAGMTKEVLALGQQIPVSLNDLASALYDIRSAGISATDAMGVLEGSSKLAVAGLGTTKEAANIVTSAINAFNLKGKDLQDVYGTIFETVKQGKTTVAELAQGFGGVAATVAQAGVSFKEFMSSIAALTTVGVPAAQAYTQIRTALGGLLTQTAQGKKLFQELGVDGIGQLIQRSGGLVGAFKALQQAAHGNQTELVKAVGGMEGYNAIVTLATKANASFEQTLKAMSTATNDFNEAYKKQTQTAQSAFILLGNSIKALAISFGSALAPAVTALAHALTDLFKVFTLLPEPIKLIIAAVAGLAAVAGPLVLTIGLMASAWGRILVTLAEMPRLLALVQGGFGLARVAALLFNGTLAAMRVIVLTLTAALGPWGIFLAVIGAAIGFVTVYLIENRKEIENWLKSNKASIDTVVGYWKQFETTIGDVVQNFEDAWKTAVADVEGIFKAMYDKVTAWFQSILNFLKTVKAALSDQNASGQGAKGYATGGHIVGPGTGTSDSIPIWGSNGEFMMKTAAVKKYGVGFMNAINNMALDLANFSVGGLVGPSLNPFPRYAEGGMIDSGGKTPVILDFGSEKFTLSADDNTVDHLARFSSRKQVSSGGRKPTWKR